MTDDDEIPHCPLHRTDPIYLAKDIKEQIDLITEKAKKHVVATTPRKRPQGNGVSTSVATQNGSGDTRNNREIEPQSKKKVAAVAPIAKKKEVPTRVKAERVSRKKNVQVSDDEEEEQVEEEDFVPSPKRRRGGR